MKNKLNTVIITLLMASVIILSTACDLIFPDGMFGDTYTADVTTNSVTIILEEGTFVESLNNGHIKAGDFYQEVIRLDATRARVVFTDDVITKGETIDIWVNSSAVTSASPFFDIEFTKPLTKSITIPSPGHAAFDFSLINGTFIYETIDPYNPSGIIDNSISILDSIGDGMNRSSGDGRRIIRTSDTELTVHFNFLELSGDVEITLWPSLFATDPTDFIVDTHSDSIYYH